jgi:hypothetical protein
MVLPFIGGDVDGTDCGRDRFNPGVFRPFAAGQHRTSTPPSFRSRVRLTGWRPLLTSSRHALDASDPVTNRWRDVHAGSRLAGRILDGR